MRTKLLRSGLGFFAFAAGISLINVLVFPYARENYGYGLIGLWLAYAAALALLTLAGCARTGRNAPCGYSPRRSPCCCSPFIC